MANGRMPGLEQPDQGFDAPASAMTGMGSDPRTSSRTAVTVTALTGRTHDRTRPPPKHQTAFARRRSSTHGGRRTVAAGARDYGGRFRRMKAPVPVRLGTVTFLMDVEVVLPMSAEVTRTSPSRAVCDVGSSFNAWR